MEIITLPEVAAKKIHCIIWAYPDYEKGVPSFQQIHQMAGLLVQAPTRTHAHQLCDYAFELNLQLQGNIKEVRHCYN